DEDAVGLRASCGSARERRVAALQEVRPAAHAASHKINARLLDLIRALRIVVAEDAVGLRAPCGSARERRVAALPDVRPAAHAASHKIKARLLDLIRAIRAIRGWFDGLSSVAAEPRYVIRGHPVPVATRMISASFHSARGRMAQSSPRHITP